MKSEEDAFARITMQIFTRASNLAQKYPLNFVAYSATALLPPTLSPTTRLLYTCIFFPAFSRDPARFISSRIVKPTWKICFREKRARRSSRPSLFSNFSATDKQHATIYYNNTVCAPSSWARSRALLRASGASFCKRPHFQITVLKADVMKRPRLSWPLPSRQFHATAHACIANLI